MRKLNLMSMNLQFFAADTGSEGNPAGDQTETHPNENGTDEVTEFDPEKLSDEQLSAIKEKFGLKTDDDVDNIVKSKQSRWQKKLDEEKAEAEKLAKMNADEKLQYELDKAKQELADERRRNSKMSLSKEASKMLSEANISANDEMLDVLVKDDAEGTKEAVETFIRLVDEAAEQKTKTALSGKAPRKNQNPGKVMTKKEIMEIKDTATRQKAIKENIHLFK